MTVVFSGPEFVAWRGHRSSELQPQTGKRESDAATLRWFDPAVVPGLLQTRDYAHAILDVCLSAVEDRGDTQAALNERLRRQQRWRVWPTRTHFLLAEQALYTRVGDRETTCVQLEMLLRPLPATATLGILPRTAHFHTAATNFIIYGDTDGDTEVVVETVTGSLRFTDEISLSDYRTAFDAVAEHAVRGTDAEALIRQAITTHR